MSTHKHIDLICVILAALTVLATVLFINGEAFGLERIVDEDAEANSGSVWFTANDMDGEWDSSSATVITLNGSEAHITGGGAYAYNGGVVISGDGHYVVSGSLTDGSITVDAKKSSKIWILLSGVDIYRSDDACLRIDQADKVFLTLAAGTENRMTSGAVYSEEALEDGADGAIFSHDDLTINGSGSLTVTAEYKHGIAANDSLVITGGNITVSAPKDAIHANDSFRLREASVTLKARDDGVSVAGEDGYMYMESGTLNVIASEDGIKSTGDITIAGGNITVDAGDDGIHSDTAIDISGGTILIKQCYEGIEAVSISVSGGDITVYPTDDGLNANGGRAFFFPPMGGPGQDTASNHTQETPRIFISGGAITVINQTGRDADGLDSNGDIIITGGDIRISLLGSGSNSALDYGSESGGVCTISGGTVIACGSYAMAEGFDVSSTQCSILYNIGAGVEADTQLSLLDSQGNTLLTWAVPCGFSSAVVSTPEMRLGETYTLFVGDMAEEITFTETSASFGDVQSTMFGGRMNWGGMGEMEGGSPGGRRGGPGGGGQGGMGGPGGMDTPPDGGFPPRP